MDRDEQYATYEIQRGWFEKVYEVPATKLGIIERLLQLHFTKANMHVRFNAGQEFFSTRILSLVEPYFIQQGIEYKILTEENIRKLERRARVKQIWRTLNLREMVRVLKTGIVNRGTCVQIPLVTTPSSHLIPATTIIPYQKTNITHKTPTASANQAITKPFHTELHLITPPPRKPLHARIIYTQRQYQADLVQKAFAYFQEYEKGILLIICGAGKTLISLWIAEKLNVNSILIGVPSRLLLSQWKHTIRSLDCFLLFPILTVSGGIGVEQITHFLEHNPKCIVLTTYSSSNKVRKASCAVRKHAHSANPQNPGFIFCLKILDEFHHLTTSDLERTTSESNTYIRMLNIKARKQLSLSATMKRIDSDEMPAKSDRIISNDDVEHFGEIIDRKCLLWAIRENVICDYSIQVIREDEETIEPYFRQLHITNENDKRLLLSAVMAITSIEKGQSHHLLIYANSMENAATINRYVSNLATHSPQFVVPGLYCSDYNSGLSSASQTEILRQFKQARAGIITCVYCLGEGWDFPLLDGVVFAENMSSSIRIVQSATRASRKNADEPAKRTKIILPILTRDDWEMEDNPDLKKVKEVIYQMGLEDETIEQKIKGGKLHLKPLPTPNKGHAQEQTDQIQEDGNISKDREMPFFECDEEWTKQIRLKTIPRTALQTTYERARRIIAQYRATGHRVNSKKDYYELCDRDVRLPKCPEKTFKNQFTDWIHYLIIPRTYYDVDQCVCQVKIYLDANPGLYTCFRDLDRVVCMLCEQDAMFPPSDLWADYYNVRNLSEIIQLSSPFRKKKSVLA